LNDFCKNCKLRNIPQSIKKKFNEYHKLTFIDCPTSDPQIKGCLIKNNYKFDWNSFCTWLNDNKKLSVQEAIEMARIGEFKEQKGRIVEE